MENSAGERCKRHDLDLAGTWQVDHLYLASYNLSLNLDLKNRSH